MNVKELQAIIGAVPDGAFGPASCAALLAHFTNKSAAAVSDSEIAVYASKLGCAVAQIKAVAKVESAGAGFDNQGRPKILFERHIFHSLTGGKYSPTVYSLSDGGGYDHSSWDKLGLACAKDSDAAFASASWGKFQVMGSNWSKLSFASPYALAHYTVENEGNHYDLLARFVQTFGLVSAIRRISADPEDCRDFAQGYNGRGYRSFDYHVKIAGAMK